MSAGEYLFILVTSLLGLLRPRFAKHSRWHGAFCAGRRVCLLLSQMTPILSEIP